MNEQGRAILSNSLKIGRNLFLIQFFCGILCLCIFEVGVLRSKRIVIDLVFPKINVTKLQTVRTFD